MNLSGRSAALDRHSVRVVRHAVQRHDLATERDQSQRNHLETRDAERDPDDGDAEDEPGNQMADRQLPADQHNPDDVAYDRPKARTSLSHPRAAERPDDVAGDPECRDPEGDGDDEDARDQSRHGVAQREPPARQYEPEDVADRAHATMLLGEVLAAHRPGRVNAGRQADLSTGLTGPHCCRGSQSVGGGPSRTYPDGFAEEGSVVRWARTILLTAVAVAIVAVGATIVSSQQDSDDEPRDVAESGPDSAPTRTNQTEVTESPTQASESPPPTPDKDRTTTFVGRVDGGAGTLAVVDHGGEATAYFCDGASLEAWLGGSFTAGRLRLSGDNGALHGSFNGWHATGSVRVEGNRFGFTLRQVSPPRGLYRVADTIDGA